MTEKSMLRNRAWKSAAKFVTINVVIRMKTVKWTRLASMDYGVTHVLAHRQYWSIGAQWQTPPSGRGNTAVLLPLCAAVTYHPDGGAAQTAQPGDLVLIPQETRYSCRFDAPELPPPRVKISDHYTALFFGAELRDNDGVPFTPGRAIFVLRPAQPEWFVRAILQMAQAARDGIPARYNREALHFLTEISIQMQTSRVPQNGVRVQTVLRQSDTGNIAQLAAQCGMSESTFRRACRAQTGVSPVQYLRKTRMAHACRLLESGELRVCDVAAECGFSDEFYFSRVFRQTVGCAPSEYRARALQARTAAPDYRDNQPKER